MVRVEEQRIWHNECLRMCEDVLVDEDLESAGAREIKIGAMSEDTLPRLRRAVCESALRD